MTQRTARIVTKNIKVKQFNLPVEEHLLSNVLSSKDCVVLDKQIFQTRNGDITVYLEYEEYTTTTTDEVEDRYQENHLDDSVDINFA